MTVEELEERVRQLELVVDVLRTELNSMRFRFEQHEAGSEEH